ncbi:unnamed protein product [Thelazia callipaeda]|uniref:C3H1-type domain-containing protein n=1 Tax=Thelazia callipaeda TaxID=103827 RepID=A0A0N5CUA8_THECL|nr:unnamed protein product [Thelazia callipaeda]
MNLKNSCQLLLDTVYSSARYQFVGGESSGNVSNFVMEYDVDAELDYDEENGYNEAIEMPVRPQSKASIDKSVKLDRSGRKGTERDMQEHNDTGVENDHVENGSSNFEVSKQDDVDHELSEDGEIDDLEEGELKSDEDNTCSIFSNEISSRREEDYGSKKQVEYLQRGDSTPVGICKFFLRGACTWGEDCKYLHIKKPRCNGSAAVESNSSESNSLHHSDTDKIHNKVRGINKPFNDSHTIYPSSSTSNENESHNNETAWERGLRQARELMIRATRKREEEPDFDRKRLVLTPNEDMDRPRTTDEESDDSHGYHKISLFKSRSQRVPHSPLSRDGIRRTNGFLMRTRIDSSFPRFRNYSNSVRSGQVNDNCHVEIDRQSVYEKNELDKPRKIPSLIDSMFGRGRSEHLKRCDYGRDGPARLPPKDLGPQVLYPNGRPTPRRYGTLRREMSPSSRYHVQRREFSAHGSRSPLSSRDSRSSSVGQSVSPHTKRRTSSFSPDSRHVVRKRNNITSVGGLLSGNQIRDPWERAHKKGRSKDRELKSITLGAELQKARRTSDDKKRSRRQDIFSSTSSISRSPSVISSATSRSRSPSRTSSVSYHKRTAHLSLASSVASKNLIDDDGSLRTTDLSSFRIPKKKRFSPSSSHHRSSTASTKGYRNLNERSVGRNSRPVPSVIQKRLFVSPLHRFGTTHRGMKDVEFMDGVNQSSKRNILSKEKENISSEQSSSESSGSSSDYTKPAAYRRKKKISGALPINKPLLSPTVEDISSDEEDDVLLLFSHITMKKDSLNSHSKLNYESDLKHPKQTLSVDTLQVSRKAIKGKDTASRITDEEYVENAIEKEERRAELLRQLKFVEEAIARKRNGLLHN